MGWNNHVCWKHTKAYCNASMCSFVGSMHISYGTTDKNNKTGQLHSEGGREERWLHTCGVWKSDFRGKLF